MVLRYWRLFDRHVARGTLTRREVIEAVQGGMTSRTLFYTLPGHEWRAEAMLVLVRETKLWTDDRERRFGELLGYEMWQNDFWLEQRRALRAAGEAPSPHHQNRAKILQTEEILSVSWTSEQYADIDDGPLTLSSPGGYRTIYNCAVHLRER